MGRSRGGRRLPWERLQGLGHLAALGVAGFLLVGVPLPGTPGGVWAGALGATAAAAGQWGRVAAVVGGMVLGGLRTAPGSVGRELMVLLLFTLAHAALRAHRGGARVAPGWQALLLAVLQGGAGLLDSSGQATSLAALQELILPALGLAAGFLLWMPLAGQDLEWDLPRSLGLAVLVVLCGSALWGWRGELLQPGWLGAFVLVQLAALVAGAGAGAGLGLGMGAVWAWSFGYPPGWAALLGLAGLVAGLLRPLGRLAALAGFWAGLLLTAPQVADPAAMEQVFLSAVTATILTALLPREVLRRWEARWGTGGQAAQEPDLRVEVGADLRKVGGLFDRMARQLEPERQARPDEEVGLFIQAVHAEACQGCPAHERCWGREAYATYWDMVELVGTVESSAASLSEAGLPRRLSLRCTHHDRLLKGVGLTLPRFRTAQEELGRSHRHNVLLPEQLRGVSRLLDAMASRVEDRAQNVGEVERALRRTLAGTVDLKRLRCSRVGPNRYRVTGQLRGRCPGPGHCERVIAPLVSRRLGRPYAVWNASCLEGPGQMGCRFELVARRRYALEVADAAVLREGELHSGDCVERTELVDGRVAVVLSDGMGTGVPAWQESHAAVTLLQSLLEAGLELHASVRTLNTLLRARSPEVRFATLDMLVVDLYSGEAEIVKIGAAPSLLVRAGRLEIVEGESPPAGVLDEVEADVRVVSLGPDDRVILASDGLWEAGGRFRPDWLAEEVARFHGEDPAVLAEILVARARELWGPDRHDDATVLVARLRPDGPATGRVAGSGW
ncbi:SpoIIE family protein phosphatase [Limnochorda pilosa]|uniref:SpoIIE family protein phosphatase n=1 Tax=Limnochorda pilosa TaxID=1555112 RepID=UPI00118730D5|nr:SpoIIE family protein phosphatase [Limnochorda pilosa]